RVVIETKLRPPAYRLQRTFCAHDVESDFRRMHFQRELDFAFLELVEDRIPSRREVGKAVFDLRITDGRKTIKQAPDLRSGEAVDDFDTEVLCGVRCLDDFLGGALADILGLSVSPDVRRQNRLVALVNIVADSLADEVS